jgi:hypothetical protein
MHAPSVMPSRKQPQKSPQRATPQRAKHRPTEHDNIDRSTEAAVDHNPRAMKPEPLDALPVRRVVDSRRKE